MLYVLHHEKFVDGKNRKLANTVQILEQSSNTHEKLFKKFTAQ